MPTQERLREVLHYNPESGIFTWRVRTTNCVKIGDIAGGDKGAGWHKIKIDGRNYFSHRLAWIYMHGSIDENLVIDHINGVRSDNRIANLRLVTRAQNMKNYSMPKHNTSGYKGVSLDRSSSKWKAQISHNGKKISLGLFATPEAAHDAYLVASAKYHGEFAKAA